MVFLGVFAPLCLGVMMRQFLQPVFFHHEDNKKHEEKKPQESFLRGSGKLKNQFRVDKENRSD